MSIWIVIGAAVVVFCLVCLVSLVMDNHRFVVRRYPVHTDKVREPLTFVFISDLHNKIYDKDNAAVYDAIRAARPDAILVGGDMTIARPAIHKAYEGDLSGMDAAIAFLRELPAIAPTYFVNGNHEQRILETGELADQNIEGLHHTKEQYASVQTLIRGFYHSLDQMGIHRLHNTAAAWSDQIMIYGYSHDCAHYEKLWSNPIPENDLTEKLGTPDRSKCNILLAHNPKFYDIYDRWGADLVLSGHVHGGLMRIGRLGFIGPDLHLFPKYSGGVYQGKNGMMILSCGLGAHTLPIRIFNPGEISVVEILPENQ